MVLEDDVNRLCNCKELDQSAVELNKWSEVRSDQWTHQKTINEQLSSGKKSQLRINDDKVDSNHHSFILFAIGNIHLLENDSWWSVDRF